MRSDPGFIWGTIHGSTGYWVAAAAVRLGLFDALQPGPLDADGLARVCQAEPAAVAVIADALVATGLLVPHEGGYELSEAAAAHLVRDAPMAMADLLLWSPGPASNWPVLDRIARGERPPEPIDDHAPAFYSKLVDATLPSQLLVARSVITTLGLPEGARLLEPGAGRAPWATAVLSADPRSSAVVNDFAEVLSGTEANLGDQAARCQLVSGDYLEADWPPPAYDLVVLGHVLRAEPDRRAALLVERAAAALAPGGRLVVTEYLGGRSPLDHPHAALLGATMLAGTLEGRLCSPALLEGWLTGAGLEVVARPEPVANTDVIIATHATTGGPS
ncbi:MAG: methyltransferase [Acidobacteriota bacterium]|nr:methyltransferase [Acidobacteriota bacterium]